MKSNEAVILTIDNAVTWAQAKMELNATMLKLRTQYGFAPAKDISVEEMDQRCKSLLDATTAVVESYVNATGKAPDRMRNTAPYKTSKDFPAKKYEGLQTYANVPDDRLKRAPLHTAEAIGNLMNFNADYLLKAEHGAAVKARTRKEWQKAEYEYVEKSAYNLRDLYDDLMERLDAPDNYITAEGYRVERRKWKKCGYYACDNYFPTAEDHMRSHAFNQSGLKVRRKDSKYCSGECRKDQENALARLKRTGTLLPEYAYEYILDDARENRAEKEVATTSEKMSKVAGLP
ncbi:hypothetical protein V7152_24585 [Neobacillus drentensis]|uniref:hypothetical protein n=1 Tax=Neobacillus drentensis TaxID=220684 RepID=UPI002FFD6B7F